MLYTFFLDTELAQDKDSGQEHKPSLQRQPPFSRSEIWRFYELLYSCRHSR